MNSFEYLDNKDVDPIYVGVFAISATLSTDPETRHENAMLHEWYNGYRKTVE